MAGNTTENTSAIRRAEVYSDIILDEIEDGFLPEGLHRDVSDFGDGDKLLVPTFGEVVLRDVIEDEDMEVDAIDTGNVVLRISDHKSAGSYLTDKARQDSYKAAAFDAAIVPKHLRALKEAYETSLLATVNEIAPGTTGAVNGLAHRYIASGTAGRLTVADIIYAKLSMDRAQLPDEGRIFIVDSLAEATLNGLANVVASDNPKWEGLVETGFAKNMRFVRNLYGFDFYVSNRLPRVAAETVNTSGIIVPAPSGNATIASGIVNVAMCVADDMTAPIMGAWRQMPSTEGARSASKGRDEFYTTARWGFGLQRRQSIIGMITSATAY